MFSSKAIPIHDKSVKEFIDTRGIHLNTLYAPTVFVQQHRKWLENNTFRIVGLDSFKYGYVTAGVTEAFNEVYRERCYVLDGEYSYHKDIGIPIFNYKDIPFGSRLIISYPFAATGNPHTDWHDILGYCKEKNISIFVDACLAGVSLGKLDLTHSCITHVAFSFSKAFNTGHIRCGVVYTTESHSSPASVTNKHFYLNHSSMLLHLDLMNKFTSDWIFQKYRINQIKLCEEHNLTQSDCVLFGLDNNKRNCLSRSLETLQSCHSQQ